jgi:hypothetical protein
MGSECEPAGPRSRCPAKATAGSPSYQEAIMAKVTRATPDPRNPPSGRATPLAAGAGWCLRFHAGPAQVGCAIPGRRASSCRLNTHPAAAKTPAHTPVRRTIARTLSVATAAPPEA